MQIRDDKRRTLGVGFFNSQSKIIGRIMSRQKRPLDRAFFRERIENAIAVRKSHLPVRPCHRLINSESDFLSGLIVDIYDRVAVIQVSSLALDQRKTYIIDALDELLELDAILEKKDVSTRRFENLDTGIEFHKGNAESLPSEFKINDLIFHIDLVDGHKTGAYLDQQFNYDRVSQLAHSGTLLDCFTFSGGFALHAARRTDLKVEGVDQSAAALELAAKNATSNNLEADWVEGNVFDVLKKRSSEIYKGDLKPYDNIILDPPSFTRNRASVPDALRGYKEIHLRAFQSVRQGGRVFTFSCSHHIDSYSFEHSAVAAAIDARVTLRRIELFEQGPDHPIFPQVPETQYLKGFAYEVVKNS